MLTQEKFEDYTFVWAFRNPKQFTFVLDNPNTYIVTVNTKDYEVAAATAKYWVYNYRMSDHIYPKDDQVYIQLWHGTPLKRLGYDINISDNAMNSKSEIREKYKVDASKFKYILAPSHFAAEKFISAWNLEAIGRTDTVLELGYPRNDFLENYTQKDIEDIVSELQLPRDKKYILYAPTWRDNQHQAGIGYTYKTEVDFDKLKANLGDEYIILFRAHYLVANSFDFDKYKGFVYDVSKVNDINHLEAYGNEIRGFYIDLDELPGPIVQTEDELIKAINNAETDRSYDEKYKAFNDKFNYLDDGKAAQRVTEAIIEE